MDNTTLKHFIVLSETLHFGQASARSSINTSALSRHIRQLEIELNVSLFDRDNRTVQLTVEGLKFQRYARNSAQQWDRPRTCRQLVPDPRRHTKDLRSTCLKRHQRHQRQPGAWGWSGF
ncbi:MAG: DNA-binding transcriptional LysR family regulator [Minisyncoccia bacterium]|jgi:DNA-binding transcriptional LysR family regulator